MLLSDLLQREQIALDLHSTSAPAAIEEVAALLQTNKAVLSLPDFTAQLLAREQVESTCLGNGIAFPHARTDHIKAMVLAIGRSKTGILFGPTAKPVHLLFAIGTPKRLANDYLAVVGSLVRIVKDPALREALLTAPDAKSFIDTLTAAEKKF